MDGEVGGLTGWVAVGDALRGTKRRRGGREVIFERRRREGVEELTLHLEQEFRDSEFLAQ